MKSLSMNLDGLFTRTSVTFHPELTADRLVLNQVKADPAAVQRVSHFLDRVRTLAGQPLYAEVVSENNFPTGAGIASSAAAFAALALASSAAMGLNLPEKELSRLARLGSGSASRSIPGGFVEWHAGGTDADSYAFSIAPANHWDLVDLVAIVAAGHKPVGSSEGHHMAPTSPLQAARIADAPRRLDVVRRAILEKDFAAFAEMVEHDSTQMHAVMMTSTPPLFYWQPASLAVIQAVAAWRRQGLACCTTLDAGPNVHVLCLSADTEEVATRLSAIPGVERLLRATAGGPAHLLSA
ncbi:MAG: diphosphomevalonate decarboxylase [Anaerolineae bacterium]|nr:diphosphomevalonate decarboxylase [Anaerolineae bacterium]